ncbi:unnamed protein product [Diplocarpon coronariae]
MASDDLSGFKGVLVSEKASHQLLSVVFTRNHGIADHTELAAMLRPGDYGALPILSCPKLWIALQQPRILGSCSVLLSAYMLGHTILFQEAFRPVGRGTAPTCHALAGVHLRHRHPGAEGTGRDPRAEDHFWCAAVAEDHSPVRNAPSRLFHHKLLSGDWLADDRVGPAGEAMVELVVGSSREHYFPEEWREWRGSMLRLTESASEQEW